MDQITIATAEAEKARKVFEKHHNEIDPNTLDSFPKGACGIASILLAHWLREKGVEDLEYVSGTCGDQSHGWLETDAFIIDITLDQFDPAFSNVYIGQSTDKHNEFVDQTRSAPTITDYDKAPLSTFLKLMSA